MKKVIFTQEWIALHPYEKADETDLYYTELANEIYHALDEACYTHNFKNMDDAKQLALRDRKSTRLNSSQIGRASCRERV